MFILFLLISCGPQLADASLSRLPLNTAVEIGTTVVLHCAAGEPPAKTRVQWLYIGYEGVSQISDERTILNSNPNHERYSLLGNETEYHLEIRDVLLSDGGTYKCLDYGGAVGTVYNGLAQLVVMGRPNCISSVESSASVLENSYQTSECFLEYKGGITPNITWSGIQPFTSAYSATATHVWGGMHFNVTRDMEGSSHYAAMYFTDDFLPVYQYYAENIPEYRLEYHGSEYRVRWGPKDLQYHPIKIVYYPGDVITCSADANPAASFQWVNIRTLEVISGDTVTVQESWAGYNQTLRCDASNQINGMNYHQNLFVDVQVKQPETTTTTTVTTPAPSTIPCTNSTGFWTSTNPDSELCLKIDSEGRLIALWRNDTTPYYVEGFGNADTMDYKHIAFSIVWPYDGGWATGYIGECHVCNGEEIILLSGVSRSRAWAPGCGQTGEILSTKLYKLTRSRPSCMGLEFDVYNPKPRVERKMGVKARPHQP